MRPTHLLIPIDGIGDIAIQNLVLAFKAKKISLSEEDIENYFTSHSDCYADTGRFENDGSYTEGEVIQAMTLGRFKKALKGLLNQ